MDGVLKSIPQRKPTVFAARHQAPTSSKLSEAPAGGGYCAPLQELLRGAILPLPRGLPGDRIWSPSKSLGAINKQNREIVDIFVAPPESFFFDADFSFLPKTRGVSRGVRFPALQVAKEALDLALKSLNFKRLVKEPWTRAWCVSQNGSGFQAFGSFCFVGKKRIEGDFWPPSTIASSGALAIFLHRS